MFVVPGTKVKNPIKSNFILCVNLTIILSIIILQIVTFLMIISTIYVNLFSHRKEVNNKHISEYILSPTDLVLLIAIICIIGLISIIYVLNSQTFSSYL